MAHQMSRSSSSGSTTITLESSSSSMVNANNRTPPPPPRSGATLRHVPPAPSSFGSSGTGKLNRRRLPSSSEQSMTLLSSSKSDSAPLVTRRVIRAAEHGSRDVLPQHSHPPPPPPRSRSYSGSSLHRSESSSSAPGSPTNGPVEVTPSQLRRRQTLRLDDGDVKQLKRDHSFGSQVSLQNGGAASPSSATIYANHRRRPQDYQQQPAFTLTHLIQSLIVFTIFYLVYDAHHKVQLAQARLEQYREEERMLVAQMDRIEQRATQLQEQLKKLREDHLEAKFAGTHKLPTAAEAAAIHKAESAHLKQEISSIKRQSQVVDSEVRGLQDFLQQQARKTLANKYGHGKAIQLTLGLEWKDADTPHEITIEFFEETPYSTYILLEQVEVGDWKGARFTEHPSHLIRAEPVKKQKADAPMLKMEFVEPSFQQHKPWTVGLSPTQDGMSYSLYINLTDNTKRHRGEICLGKIVGGFDALQELMHVEAREEEKYRMARSVEVTSLNVVSTRQSKIRSS